jgi:hypothetical protein
MTNSENSKPTYENDDPRKTSFQISRNLIISLLPYFLIALPIFSYLAFIIFYGSNVPEGDDYTALTIVRKSLSGTLTFFDVWKNQYGHRMLFPNILFLLDGSLFRFNLKVLMYLGWVFTTISFIFLYVTLRKNERLSLWGMVPVAFLLFTLFQGGNNLWSFQVAWYLILACLSGMIFLLINKEEKTWAFFAAAGLSIIASFSSFQGLFLWPAGLVCLLLLTFSLKRFIAWILFSFLTIGIYFSGDNAPVFSGHSIFSISRLIQSIYMFFVYIGAIFPISSFPLHMEINTLLFVLAGIGLALFLLGIYAGTYAIKAVWEKKEFIAPLSLLVFVLLFQLALAIGRGSGIGIIGAIGGHYTTFSILYLITIYLIATLAYSANKNRILTRVFFFSFLTIIIMQISQSFYIGISQGRVSLSQKEGVGEIIKKYGGKSDLLSRILILGPVLWNANLNEFDKDILFAKKFHLIFLTSSYPIPSNLSQQEHFPPEKLLPIPQLIKNLLNKNNNYSDAWYILSYLYNEKPDLHQAFPIISDRSTRSIHKLIQWTLIPTNDISDLIDPYRSTLTELDKSLSK